MKGDIFRFASIVLVVPALIFGLSSPVSAIKGDLVEDNYIDWFDLDVLAEKWLNDCNSANNWCDGADIDHSSKADFGDFGLLGQGWLTVPEPNLVGHWNFNEGLGSTTYDSSGNDNDGTFNGNPQWVAGKIGSFALDFDGDDDYVEVPSDSSLNVQYITMCAWVKPYSAVLSNNNIFLNRRMTNPGAYTLYLQDSDRKWQAQVRLDGSEGTDRRIGSDDVATTDWAYVCGTYDGDKLKLYINSVLQAAVNDANGTIDTDNPDILTIGAHPNPAAYFDGQIDDVRIYERALSAEEIGELYIEGLGNEASNPYPTDGAVDVHLNVILSWLSGKDAVSHDVYFGTNHTDVNEANTSDPNIYMGNQGTNSWDTKNYDPSGLKYIKSYYWRIDEVDDSSDRYKGDVWSFTTRASFDPNIDLVSWWKLDEMSGSTAYDSSSSGNNGTLVYDVNWEPTGGRIDGAARFSETDNRSRIDIPTTGMEASAGTISLWACTTEPQWSYRFLFGVKNNDGNRIQLYMDSYDRWLDLGLGDQHHERDAIYRLGIDTWCHIVLTWDGSNYAVYINGDERMVTGSYTGLSVLEPTANLGNNGDSRVNDRTQGFNGLLDGVRIWEKVLSAIEVVDVYNEAGYVPVLTATNPDPNDKATNVPVDVVLSWSPGDYAASHDVYLGTNESHVNNGTGGTFKGNQEPNSYDPCNIEYDTAYFWRIDEVNGLDTWQGETWSFKTQEEPIPPEKASNPFPPNSTTGVCVFAKLGWTMGSYATSHDVYFGTSESDVNDGTGGTFKGNQLATIFSPGTMAVSTTYYWRIDEKNKFDTTGGDVWQFTTEAVPSAPAKASNPSPSQLAIDVDTGDNLSWTAGVGAISHDVYFGTDFNDVNSATEPNTLPGRGNQSGTTFDPGIMDVNTTHYWRIDERNPAGVTTGDVWSFTTRTQLGEEELAPWYVLHKDWDPNGDKTASLNDFNGVHPRYLLTAADVVDLKSKISGGVYRKIWKLIKQKADTYKDLDPPSNYEDEESMREAGRGIPWMALAYLLTEDPNYLTGATHWMTTICGYPHWQWNYTLGAGECLLGVSMGYDWLHDELTVSDKNLIRDKLIDVATDVNNWAQQRERWLANHNHVEFSGVAAAAFVLYDDANAVNVMDWIARSDRDFQAAFLSGSYDGSCTEGHQYWAYSMESVLCYTEAAKLLMNTNYYNNNKWLENAANFIIFSTIPDFNMIPEQPGFANCAMSYGDSGRDSYRDYRSHGPTHILNLIASRYDNGYAQWLADEMVKRGIGITEEYDFRAWANLLWYDETVQPAPIANLSTFRHFDNAGWVVSRSGWDANAVMVGFKCGPLHGHKLQPYYDLQVDEDWPGTRDPNVQELYGRKYHEINGGHGHPDVDSFQVYAYGKWLAIDPGKETPKWTESHNTILVNGIGQLGEGSMWFDRPAVIDAKAKSTIIKAENYADYDYLIGDAENIYRDPNLTKFLRHFVYIKPDIVLIADEIGATVSTGIEWRLHAEDNISEVNSDYFLVSTDDVVMDTHFIHPETISTSIDGQYLKANFNSTGTDMIAAVLHPRKDTDDASNIVSWSYVDSVLSVTIGIGAEEIDVELDLAEQEVNIN